MDRQVVATCHYAKPSPLSNPAQLSSLSQYRLQPPERK